MQSPKALLREQKRELFSQLSVEEKSIVDTEIQSRLLTTDEYINCKTVLTYISMSSEIQTRGIIFAAFANAKRVAVPKTESDFSLSFYYIDSFSQLTSGRFGVLEPDADTCEKVTDFSNCICVTPSCCCDLSGYRIGHGKGCYDRFFSQNTHGDIVKIFLCPSTAVEINIPHDDTDVRADIIVTDKYVRHIGKSEQLKEDNYE